MRYWDLRKDMEYYRVVKFRLDNLRGDTILDVGAHDTPCVTWGNFKRRVIVDPGTVPAWKGVEHIKKPWPTMINFPVDVVLCLQVIEHISNPQVMEFTKHLFRVASILIVSVPLDWPAGTCEQQVQDPISHEKFRSVMWKRDPIWSMVVQDAGLKRLVASGEL